MGIQGFSGAYDQELLLPCRARPSVGEFGIDIFFFLMLIALQELVRNGKGVF